MRLHVNEYYGTYFTERCLRATLLRVVDETERCMHRRGHKIRGQNAHSHADSSKIKQIYQRVRASSRR